ncbi:MAG: putative porin [Candidatus Binatia bacterium]|jgi:hypothetical protein
MIQVTGKAWCGVILIAAILAWLAPAYAEDKSDKSLLDVLRQKQVLTQQDYERLKSSELTPAQRSALIDVLRDKGILTKDEAAKLESAAPPVPVAASAAEKAAAAESQASLLAKLPKWLSYITPFGDIRLRDEGFYQEGAVARNRGRFRARIGLTVNASDEISGTVRLATGDPNDPISTNQSFQNTFTRKSINLDWAYLTLKPGKTFGLEPGWVTVTAGKFGLTNYRTSELVWDDDVSPEGATETLNLVDQRAGVLRGLRVNAFQWTVNEVSNGADPWMGGGQVVSDAAFGTLATATVGFADYNYQNLNEVARTFLSPYTGSAPFTANSSQNTSLVNSNDVVLSAKDANGHQKILRYASGYNILNWTGELNSPDPLGLGVPAGLFGDVAYNSQADGRNVGCYVGAGIGNAGRDWYHNVLTNQGDWGLSYTYARVEKDAVLSIFSFSDIDQFSTAPAKGASSRPTQNGSTNLMAHILRLDYLVLPNLQLTAKAYVENVLDRRISNAALTGNPTLLRTQLDAMLRF